VAAARDRVSAHRRYGRLGRSPDAAGWPLRILGPPLQLLLRAGPAPRPRFADGNRPTDAERAATFATFIAGAGTYTFDGRTLGLRADFRKNPNEMTGEVWHWELDLARGDTLRFIFREPPFLPGRVWRTTLVRAD
jgi:hypothetical protein